MVETRKISSPDFSVFKAPVTRWSLSLRDNIDNEDMLMIDFLGDIPSFQMNPLSLGQEVEIPFGNRKLNMLIRNISIGFEDSKISTSLTLATKKILLDTTLKEDYSPKEGITLQAAIHDIFSRLDLDCQTFFHGDVGTNIKFNASINTSNNVLDFLKSQIFEIDNQVVITCWFDAFGVFHVAYTGKGEGNLATIDKNKDDIIKVNINLSQRWENRTVVVDNSGVKKEKSSTVFAVNEQGKQGKLVSRPDRVGATNNNEQTKAIKKVSVLSSECVCLVPGIFFDDLDQFADCIYSFMTLENFSIETDGKYLVKGCEITGDNSRVQTTFTLAYPQTQLTKPVKIKNITNENPCDDCDNSDEEIV